MNPNLIAAIVSGFSAVVTVSGATYAAIRSGRDKKDRESDRTVAQKTAEKLDKEKDQIAEQTRSMLLQDIRDELARTKESLEKATRDAEKYRAEARALRDALIEKNDRIDAQARVIRKLTGKAERLARRAEVLEEWIKTNERRFRELGIEGLPFDLLEDRQHQDLDDEDEV